MSDSSPDEARRGTLPRLRILHLLVFTAILSLVMSAYLSMWRLLRSSNPDSTMPEFSGGISILVIAQWLSITACIAVAIFGLAWGRRGIGFPVQPGHWMAIYLTIAWAYETMLTVVWHSGFPAVVPIAGRMIAFVFHCLMTTLWVVAFWREPARIWRWGWGAMALRSAFSTLLVVFYFLAKCIEWLLEVFWYNHQLNWQPFPLRVLGSYSSLFMMWIPNFMLLAFLVIATVADFRQARQRHWSHWMVLILTFVSTLISTGYMITFYYLA